eukprot:765147-Hanusia_phi.AAC.7
MASIQSPRRLYACLGLEEEEAEAEAEEVEVVGVEMEVEMAWRVIAAIEMMVSTERALLDCLVSHRSCRRDALRLYDLASAPERWRVLAVKEEGEVACRHVSSL